MQTRRLGAGILALLTACASTPRHASASIDPYEAALAAARYELRVLTSGTAGVEPVAVDEEEFHEAMRMLASTIPPSHSPQETGRWLMEGGLEADLLAEVERGQVVRLMPLEDTSPLDAATAAEMRRKYLSLCQHDYEGGDCLGLLTDGPTLQRDDLRTLALALSLKGVLKETRTALAGMVSPQALVAMIAWTAGFYLLLWLLPEPASKALAAALTMTLLAWLPVHTLWSLMEGWARLVHEVDRSTRFEQLEVASQRFSRVMGEETARVLVMLVTAALSGSVASLAMKLPKLPGFTRASVQAEAQGLRLAEVGEVEAVAATEEGTFTLMVRSPSARGGTAMVEATEIAEARASAVTIIRHRGGNRQVSMNGQRWHVPANRSIKELPAKDPVGDELQAAAQRAAKGWSRNDLSDAELEAINRARAQGKYLEANLWERMYRGRWVENVLREQFKHLRWSRTGVDAFDPATGYRYEVLSGTASNMELHGRRMTDELFRLITF
ncbi:SitA5 family polymorphic toxin [Hyalangium gracile]|uniref:SitA5 family polymorphic toxin n=1 Tax=Hyalangium gracile TaxID=394092 RepID=UPI001CCD3D35|nr:hypothetical protein [Hyalangium gracile]